MLDRIEIAKPCPANWDEMKGDDQVRHCALCRLNVYNLSEMSREDATRLVQKTEGRLCVRFYRREDGTMITRDCPKGLKAFRQRAARRLVLAGAFILSAVGCGRIGDQLKEDFLGTPSGVVMGKMPVSRPVTGAVAVLTPPTTTKTTTKAPAKKK